MKVAIVHDYLVEFGGAERVLEVLCEIWPKAPIYTAFYRKGSSAYERFKKKKIITSFAQNVPFFAKFLHSPLRFLAPKIWGSFASQLADFDVVITSASWYVTKGVLGKRPDLSSSRSPGQGLALVRPIEICYCHTPPRYLYGYKTARDFKKNPLIRAYALFINHFMRVYDFEAAQRVDYFIANSKEVASRIKKFYRRDSKVIYPPVDVFSYQRPVTRDQKKTGDLTLATGYFLVVSRLSAAKNVDVIVEVCSKLNLPLKVVGMGRELGVLKNLAYRLQSTNEYSSSEAKRNREESSRQARTIANGVQFLGEVSDQELIKFYQNCRAVIFAASEEDFGIVPVEAMAAGKPVIVLAEGGVLESVIDWSVGGKGKCTGVYFDPATTGSLTLALNNFMDLEKKGYFDAKFIRNHAQKFSRERFKREILKFVEGKLK